MNLFHSKRFFLKTFALGVFISIILFFQNCSQQNKTNVPITDINSFTKNSLIQFDKESINFYENQNSITVSLSEAAANMSIQVNYQLIQLNSNNISTETSIGKFSGQVLLSPFMKSSEIVILGNSSQSINSDYSSIFLEVTYFHESQQVVKIPLIFKNQSVLSNANLTTSTIDNILSNANLTTSTVDNILTNTSSLLPIPNTQNLENTKPYNKLVRPMKIRFLSNYFNKQQIYSQKENSYPQGYFEFEVLRNQNFEVAENLTYEIRPINNSNVNQKFVVNNVGTIDFQIGEQKKIISLQYPSLQELANRTTNSPYSQNNLVYLLKITKGDQVVADRLISLISFYGIQLGKLDNTTNYMTELIFSYNPVRFYSVQIDNKNEEQTCQLCPDFKYSMDGSKANNVPFLAYDYQLYQLSNPVSEGSHIRLKGELELDALTLNLVTLRDGNTFKSNNIRIFYNDTSGVIINQLTNEVLIELTTIDPLINTSIQNYPLTVFNFWCTGITSKNCGIYDGYLPKVSQTAILPFKSKY